jgi:hypothetical protein
VNIPFIFMFGKKKRKGCNTLNCNCLFTGVVKLGILFERMNTDIGF